MSLFSKSSVSNADLKISCFSFREDNKTSIFLHRMHVWNEDFQVYLFLRFVSKRIYIFTADEKDLRAFRFIVRSNVMFYSPSPVLRADSSPLEPRSLCFRNKSWSIIIPGICVLMKDFTRRFLATMHSLCSPAAQESANEVVLCFSHWSVIDFA